MLYFNQNHYLIMKSFSNSPVTVPLSKCCLVLPLSDQPDGLISDPLTLVPAGVCTVVVVNVAGGPVRWRKSGQFGFTKIILIIYIIHTWCSLPSLQPVLGLQPQQMESLHDLHCLDQD